MNELVWSEKWPTVEGAYFVRAKDTEKRETPYDFIEISSDWVRNGAFSGDFYGVGQSVVLGFGMYEFAGPVALPKEPDAETAEVKETNND